MILNHYLDGLSTAPGVSSFANPEDSSRMADSLRRCSAPAARALLSPAQAEKLLALPLAIFESREGKTLSVAVANDSREAREALRFACGMEVRITVVDSAVLSDAIFRAYRGDETALRSAFERVPCGGRAANRSGLTTSKPELRDVAGEAGEFLTALIDYGVSHNASDLHLIPLREHSVIRLRVNGELQSARIENHACRLHERLIGRIKALCGLDGSQRNKPLDGGFSFACAGRRVNVRVSIMPTLHGEKAVLRLLSNRGLPPLDALGFSPSLLDRLQEVMRRDEGCLLFCGPTGSGKTTSMYSIAHEFARRNLSVVTLEDPIEIEIDGIAQSGVNERQGLDYPTMLRALLRQDPDVVMLGEIRDALSARVAFQAALTGHMLLSTVHASDVFEALLRLKNLELDFLTISQALKVILCQRLMPVLCPACKVIDLNASNASGARIYKPSACVECDYSGFGSRKLIVEALFVDNKFAMEVRGGRIARSELISSISSESYFSGEDALKSLLLEGSITLQQFLTHSATTEL